MRSTPGSTAHRIVLTLSLLLVAGGTALIATPADPAEAQPVVAPASMVVEPHYLVPADLQVHPEYQAAIQAHLSEMRSWFQGKVGRTFELAPLRLVRGPSYVTMRCGGQPTPECASDRTQVPNWGTAVQQAVPMSPYSVKLTFAQGGGGVAGANLVGQMAGFAMVGDYVLEPISGLRDPEVLHCGYAAGGCALNTAKGTVAHELGHAFGVHHPPDFEPGRLVMRTHAQYPEAGFLPHDVTILRNNPFLNRSAYSDGPWLGYEAPDEVVRQRSVDLPGTDLMPTDRLYFMHGAGEVELPAVITSTKATVTVPYGFGSGMFQMRRGAARGNGVPVNVISAETAPAPPKNVSVTALSASQIRVAWDDVSTNEAGFRLLDGDDFYMVEADATSFVLGGLQPETYKCFKVQAYNYGGSSQFVPGDGWRCAGTPPETPPSAPANVSAQTASYTAMRVMWTDTSNNESGFQVTDGGTTWKIGRDVTYFLLDSLAPGTAKCFKVRAYNAVGSSPWSPSSCAILPAPTTAS